LAVFATHFARLQARKSLPGGHPEIQNPGRDARRGFVGRIIDRFAQRDARR
jgi:hypothetical protein